MKVLVGIVGTLLLIGVIALTIRDRGNRERIDELTVERDALIVTVNAQTAALAEHEVEFTEERAELQNEIGQARVAVQHAEATGRWLMSALRDSVPPGLVPLIDEIEAQSELEREAYRAQLAGLEQIVAAQDALLDEYRTANATLHAALAATTDLASAWERQANPPFITKLWRDVPKYAVGAGAALVLVAATGG